MIYSLLFFLFFVFSHVSIFNIDFAVGNANDEQIVTLARKGSINLTKFGAKASRASERHLRRDEEVSIQEAELAHEEPIPTFFESSVPNLADSEIPVSDTNPSIEISSSKKTKVDITFDGINFRDNSPLLIPPDPIGAAGPYSVIQVANVRIEARAKTKHGKLLWNSDLIDFYKTVRTPGSRVFDPKIIYDFQEDRFVVVVLERLASREISSILLAVSKTDHPGVDTSHWYFTKIDSAIDGAWADYPGFEVDEKAIYITNNMFTFRTGRFVQSLLFIVEKKGFYNGKKATSKFYAFPRNVATYMPAEVQRLDGTGTDVSTYLVAYSGFTNGEQNLVSVVGVSDPLGATTFTQVFVALGSMGEIDEKIALPLPDAPQLGTDARIEVNNRRALDAIWHNGSLWMTTTVLWQGKTTAFWIELDTTGESIGLKQSGHIVGEQIAHGAYTYFASVSVNKRGVAAFGFCASAPNIYAGAYVTWRLPSDSPGSVRRPETVKTGVAPYIRTFGGGRNRWGDYSGIALDPSDHESFWVNNVYADETCLEFSDGEDGCWGTAWGRLPVSKKMHKIKPGKNSKMMSGKMSKSSKATKRKSGKAIIRRAKDKVR